MPEKKGRNRAERWPNTVARPPRDHFHVGRHREQTRYRVAEMYRERQPHHHSRDRAPKAVSTPASGWKYGYRVTTWRMQKDG